MAYKDPKKQRAAMKRWRDKHPDYMKRYYRNVVRVIDPPKTNRTIKNRQPLPEEVEV